MLEELEAAEEHVRTAMQECLDNGFPAECLEEMSQVLMLIEGLIERIIPVQEQTN